MLNELIEYSRAGNCPVCGRYGSSEPWEEYWCPYCGPDNGTLALRQINKITNRLDLIERFIQWV